MGESRSCFLFDQQRLSEKHDFVFIKIYYEYHHQWTQRSISYNGSFEKSKEFLTCKSTINFGYNMENFNPSKSL